MIKILIELIFAFIALKWLIIPFFNDLHINKMRKKTKQNIAKLEYVISLNGFMGKGKTSLSVGIITDLTEKISGEISFELDKTRAELKDIDFLKFDEDFEKYYHENFFDNNCYIFKTINDFLNEQEIDGFFTDFLLVESVKLKLIKYLIRYFILNIRGIITYSKGYIFNRYTKKPGMLLDDKGLEMVKSLEANNWQFELGVIYFDDEVQITRGNFQSGSKAYKISGITITLALIRNMSLGTTYRITTKQLVSNEEKQNRLLCGSNISIENVSPVLTSKKIRNLLFKIDKQILACILRAKNFNIFLKNCFKKKKNRVNAKIVLKDYFKQKSLYRVFHYYIQMINNYLFSKGYNIYDIRVYDDSEKLGRENTKDNIVYTSMKLVMPLNYVYGNYDTHEYFWKLRMLEYFSSKILYREFTSTNHDDTNEAFLNVLSEFSNKIKKMKEKGK